MHHLGSTIHYCHDGVLATTISGQIRNEIYAHFLPFGFWNSQGLETSLFHRVVSLLQLAGRAALYELSDISCHALPPEVASNLPNRPLYSWVR